MTDTPVQTSVFVSYSHDSDEHQMWVTELAIALEREPDLTVTFDQFDLFFGTDLTHFMDRGLECERIVVVSTPGYIRKAKERKGGVGYEVSLITADLVRDMAQDKFIPILREGDEVPSFLSSKVWADFRENETYDRELRKLLAAIRRQAPVARPPKRTSPIAQPTYTHTPPAPGPLKPASLTFGTSTDGNTVELLLTGKGDLPALNVRVAVEFAPAPRMVIDFGDIAPDQTVTVNLSDIAREQGVDFRVFQEQFNTAVMGLGSSDNRFLLLYEDEHGNERATAFIFVRQEKQIGLQAVPVTVSYPDPKLPENRPKIRLTFAKKPEGQPVTRTDILDGGLNYPVMTVRNNGSDEAFNITSRFEDMGGIQVLLPRIDNLAPAQSTAVKHSDLVYVRHDGETLKKSNLWMFIFAFNLAAAASRSEPPAWFKKPLPVSVEYRDAKGNRYITRYTTTLSEGHHLEFKGDSLLT